MANEYIELKRQLPDIIKGCNSDGDIYSISYDYIPTIETPESSYTVSTCITVIATVRNNITGQALRTPITLMQLPIPTDLGYKVSGTFYTMMGIDRRASGWYITTQSSSNKEKELIMELIPSAGLRITMYNRYGEIAVTLGSQKRNKHKINLGIFLKALTGKTYKELAVSLGIRNRYVVSTLVNEPNRDECIDITLSSIADKLGQLPEEFRFKELKRRLYNKQFMRVGALRSRTERNISFSSRALYKELAKDVLDYKKGTTLTKEMLIELDSSDIDTIFVNHNNSVYELKKYNLSEEDLSEEELLTMCNMYATALDGYPTLDDRYELDNRKTVTYRDSVTERIQNKLSQINDVVSRHFLVGGPSADVSEIIYPKFDIDDLLRDIKSSSNEAETSETTNSLAVRAKRYKVVADYSGRTGAEMVKVKDTERGIYDPYQTPESKKVGLVHYRTLTAKQDTDGVYKGMYIKVDNGERVAGEPVLLSPYEVSKYYIAIWEEDLSKEKVRCYYGGKVLEVERSKVQYQEYSCFNNISLPTAVIPFMNHSDGKRLVMGGNQGKQTALTIKRRRPIVSTGVYGIYEEDILYAETILIKHYIDNADSLEYEISYDEFIKLPIKLVDTDLSIPGYRKLIFEMELPNGDLRKLSQTIQFCRKTTENTMTQYNINPSPNMTYQGREIVAYDMSIDIRKYRLDYNVNLGCMKVKDYSCFDTDIALGNNFLIGYKTWLSSNLDDGITISAGLLGTNMLAHIQITAVKAELDDPRDNEYESYGVYGNSSNLKNFQANGLPKVGTHLKPKSVVISKYKETSNGVKNTSIRLDAVTEGEVILSDVSGKFALVYIARIAEVSVGDKLTGDHGNKGVIAKIVPESQMPYLQDGTPLQILLNPLGLPSRMNYSQLLVAVLSYAYKKSGNKDGIVISPQNEGCLDYVKEMADKYDVKPEYLYDGRTGRKFDRPSTVGMLYMKKLTHVADSKANSTGVNGKRNPITMQPNKGKKIGGGQTIGEMEVWALSSVGAFKTIQDLMSIQSDDVKSSRAIKTYSDQGDESVFTDRNNNNDSAILALTRTLCVDIINKDNGYFPKVMTDKDICHLSKKAIENHKDSLQDPNVFGLTKDPVMLPKTRKMWGYINLNCEIIHPIWIYKGKVPNLIVATEVSLKDDGELDLNKRTLTSDILRKVINGDSFIAIRESGEIFYTKSKSISGYDWKTGIETVCKCFKISKLDSATIYYSDELSSIKDKIAKDGRDSNKEKELFECHEIISTINMLKEQEIDLKDFVISHFPIMPRNFRLEAMGRKSDFDLYYTSIMSLAEANKTMSRATDVYKAITGFIGLDEKFELPKEKAANTLLSYFTGKGKDNSDGFIRDNMMTKIVSQSFRGVIVPAESGLVTILQAGIPFKFAVNCLQEFIKPVLLKKYPELSYNTELIDPNTINEVLDAICNRDVDGIKDLLMISNREDAETMLRGMISDIKTLAESKPVAIGRQPTLHRFGIRSFYPVLVFDEAIHIHPLVCNAYNADFDGDLMWGVWPITQSSGNEILEKISPASEMMNPKDDSFVLEPTQDTLLGCYLVTMLHENKLSIQDSEDYFNKYYKCENVKYYNSLEQLSYDVDMFYTNPKDLICYTKDRSHKYLSTAGRILFNSIIPNGFTDEIFTNPLGIPYVKSDNYKDLRFDGLIRKKSDKNSILKTYAMSDITKYILSNCSNTVTCDVLDSILKFGVYSCDNSGITLGMDDFIQHPEIDVMVEKSKVIVDKINHYYEIGLSTEEDRKESCSKIYRYMTSYIKGTLLDYYDRNNNLFIIIDSGSRGNVSQLMQTCGIIGEVGNTGNVVLSNYCRGLSSSDQIVVSYGTRTGVSAVQNDTAKAGELTRSSVYTAYNFKVVDHDCGNEDNEEEVLYSDELLSCKLNGSEEDTDLEDFIGCLINADDINYSKYLTLSGDKFTSDTIYFIKKNHIREINTSNGVIRIKYKLSDMFYNLLLNRVGKDLPYLKQVFTKTVDGDTHEIGIISKETIDYVEKKNLETIKVRTMLSCKSIGGVCAKCYGLKTETQKYPKSMPPEMIGVTAAQAVGEPATQLNLNKINLGAGVSQGSEVDMFKAYVKGSVPKKGNKELMAIMSSFNGFCKVTEMGKDFVMIKNGDKSHKVHKGKLLVKNGEYVKQGDMLSKGIIDVNEITIDDRSLEIKRRQIELLKVFYNLFASNDIQISVRNFEAIVRIQTSLVRILDSENDNFKSGHIYLLEEVRKENDPSIDYYCGVENTSTVINKYGGFLSNFSYVSFAENLVKSTLIPSRHECKLKSVLSSIVIGEDVVANRPKTLTTLNYANVNDKINDSNKDTEDEELLSKIVSVSEKQDLEDLFSGIEDLDIIGDLDNFNDLQEVAIEEEIIDEPKVLNSFTKKKTENGEP